MKKIIFFVGAGFIVFQSCGDGTTTHVKVTDSVTNKEAQAMIDAPDTSMEHSPSATEASSAAFAVKAANGGMMEVELGKWAQEHAASSRVKQFGAMMVTDHSKANEELKSLAYAKHITLPSEVEGEMKQHMDQLMTLKGTEFDRVYVNMMVDDHTKDVADFEKASKELSDADLKNFAARTLPVLQKHHIAIKSIKDKM